jgi:hypothetical protein
MPNPSIDGPWGVEHAGAEDQAAEIAWEHDASL